MKYIIAVGISLIVALGLFLVITKYIANKKKEALEAGGIDLSNREGLNEGDDEKIINKIKKENLGAQKKVVADAPIIEIGDAIYKSKGVVNDDEELLYVTLGRIKSKAVLATLNNYFKATYHITLMAFLQSFLDQSELGQVNLILQKLK